MKIFCAILAITLFCFNYQICELFYSNNLQKWWELKQNIYNVVIALSFFVAFKCSTERWLKMFLEIGLGFCVADCIDRIFFDINKFQSSDCYMVAITIAFAVYKFKKNGTKNTR